MGKYAKHFPFGVPATIVFIGIFMGFLTASITIFRLINYMIFMREDSDNKKVFMVISTISFMVYVVATIKNFNLCFAFHKEGRDSFLNNYNIIALIAIICAFVEGIVYSTTDFTATQVFFSFGAIASFCLLVTFIGHRELRYSQFDRVQQYNSGQRNEIEDVEELPKYPAIVQVQKFQEDI